MMLWKPDIVCQGQHVCSVEPQLTYILIHTPTTYSKTRSVQWVVGKKRTFYIRIFVFSWVLHGSEALLISIRDYPNLHTFELSNFSSKLSQVLSNDKCSNKHDPCGRVMSQYNTFNANKAISLHFAYFKLSKSM